MYIALKSNGFLLLTLLLLSCNSKKQGPTGRGAQGPIVADGFVVQPTLMSENVEVPGSLLPTEETQIRSEVSGKVIKLNIPEGSVVQRGVLLVKLFDGDLQAQLRKLNVQLQIAQKTEERQRELLKINGISQQDYDLIELNVENLKADIESVKIAIDKTEIRSPYRGRVGLRNISLGSYISPSDIITTLRQVDELKIEFSIPERYAQNISKNYKVKFRIDGGSQTHTATVIATENSVEQSTRTLRVRAVVDKLHSELVPGLFARVSLQLGQDSNALMIPTQAVIPQARNKQVIVFKKDSVQFKVVETGIRDSAYVQITSGLQAGDTVIITGLMAIRANAKVKLSQVHQYQKVN